MGKKTVNSSGKRKTSIARASFKEGQAVVRINKKLLSAVEPELIREKIREPLNLVGDLAKNLDIAVTVRGGGIMGQADAARTAIARGLIDWTNDLSLKDLFLKHDRTFLVNDYRQKEPKKYGGRGARARRQKSYR
ncbi:MAG TPA: 30S ribosomal protein S9 [Candidatus Acidoferrales bacterium]|nr:30S ribosomal protein S9 [Candidatus Acidoferrales bacterium]